MADLKTKVNDASVEEFLDGFPEDKRKDCYKILEIMQEVTQNEPKMWGTSIIGFGDYHYEYKSGRAGDFFLTGFSPRKQNLTLYINGGFDQYSSLLERLGKYKTGKACLYIKKLDDVDIQVLKEIVTKSVNEISKNNS
jgi:hypothetical protein